MKIYINREPVGGPWGGGNKTISKLCEKLVDTGNEVVFNLQDSIDIIFVLIPGPIILENGTKILLLIKITIKIVKLFNVWEM